ncbi:uncharacterized protein LOC121389499 [Gigantopelta aegis]|uniref:uncharacterized protein LOC121389499 n=1 Tax=Gigantopelta aegis TaxID=1735272 RepID=UPI001B8886EB|nr:uncharacterized protein LOC121389499 [Gigantopelta aegis]
MMVTVKCDVVVVLTLVHLSGHTFAVDSRCTSDNGLIPDQSRCDTFLICVLGEVRRSITCSDGLLFDVNARKCNFKDNVDCGGRARDMPKTKPCVPRQITVTIVAENDQVEPRFSISTSVTAPSQSLRNFLLMAAGQNDAFRFKSRDIGNFGEFVTSINGLDSNPAALTAWVPFLFSGGQLMEGIKATVPSIDSVYLFKFYSFQDGCTDEQCQAISRQFLS